MTTTGIPPGILQEGSIARARTQRRNTIKKFFFITSITVLLAAFLFYFSASILVAIQYTLLVVLFGLLILFSPALATLLAIILVLGSLYY